MVSNFRTIPLKCMSLWVCEGILASISPQGEFDYPSGTGVGLRAACPTTKNIEPRIKQRGSCHRPWMSHAMWITRCSQEPYKEDSAGPSTPFWKQRTMIRLHISQIRKLRTSWEIPPLLTETLAETSRLFSQSCSRFWFLFIFFLMGKKMYPFCLSKLLTPSQTKCYEILTEGPPITRVS